MLISAAVSKRNGNFLEFRISILTSITSCLDTLNEMLLIEFLLKLYISEREFKYFPLELSRSSRFDRVDWCFP